VALVKMIRDITTKMRTGMDICHPRLRAIGTGGHMLSSMPI